MPNAKGGKGYKKGKHDEGDAELIECNADENQMYGRAMKSLGNRRFQVFCNDNKERICRVCGSMRKSQWIEKGSIVLISLRDLSMSTVHGSDKKDIQNGDIIGLIDPSLIGKMKKVPGVNPLLFVDIENRESESLKKSIKAQKDGILEDEDDFFNRDSDSDSDSKSGDEEGDNDEKEKKQKEKAKERDVERGLARGIKYKENDDCDINIDDI